MFRPALLTACLEEKLSTACKQLLSAVELSVQIGAVVGSTGGLSSNDVNVDTRPFRKSIVARASTSSATKPASSAGVRS